MPAIHLERIHQVKVDELIYERGGFMRTSLKRQKEHEAKVARKYERLQMMRALIATHEKQPKPDYEYLKELYKKVDNLQTQLSVMA